MVSVIPQNHGRRALRSTAIIIVIFVAIAWLIVGALAWRDYRSLIERSNAEKRLAVSSIQNHLGTLLNATEQIANGIARTYRDRGEALREDFNYHQEMSSILLDFTRDILSISIADKEGQFVATTLQFPAPTSSSLRDRPYFQAFLAGHRDVYIDRVTEGRISGRLVLNIAYPINAALAPHYQFDGAVIIAVRPSVAIRTLEDAGLEARTSMVVLDQSNHPVLTVRNGELVESSSERIIVPEEILRRSVIMNDASDTEDRQDIWVKLSPEMAARISISDQPLLALWWRNMVENSLVAVLLTGFAIVVMLYMRRLIRLLAREHTKRTISEDNLRFRVADLEATRTDLESARAAAEKANAAKTDFLAAMSHEIRTPMNGILGFIDLLRRSPLDEQQKTYMRRVIDASKSLQAILDEILDFSKIEAGHVRITSERFDLKELIDGIIDWARAQVTRKNLLIEKHIPDGIPRFVIGDAHRLRQVLINLVSNALKFTHDGHILISIRETVRAPEMIELHFSVADTGPGISRADQATLFKPFFQVDRPNYRARGGTGLGLAICRQLIEIQGGRIGVESEPEEGSEFWFNLEFQLPSQEVLRPQLASITEKKADVGPIKVLVVDDIAMNRELIAAILEGAGFEITEAESGARALNLARDNSFDLVLMDIMMPEMDGLETTARLRKIGRFENIPMIGLSASVLPDQIEVYRNSGLDGFVPKPVDADVLLATIREQLSAAAARQAE